MKINNKYKVHLQGKYNKAVNACLNCDFSFHKLKLFNLGHGNIFENIIGFNESNIGLVTIWECPICFNKWFFHTHSYEFYEHFLNTIKKGTNKHYK